MNWTQCRQMIRFELKQTPFHYYVANMLTAALFGLLFATIIQADMLQTESTVMSVDILFIASVGASVYMWRPSMFVIKEVKSNFYVAQLQILLRHMPVSLQTIIVSRMLTGVMYSLGWSVVFLTAFFSVMPAGEFPGSFSNYVSFSLVWTFIILSLAGVNPAAEPGAKMGKSYLAMWWTVAAGVFFSLFLLTRFITGKFVFEWLVAGTVHMPVVLPLLALFFTAGMTWYWIRYMSRYLRSTDYHV